jgi:hypothetical protein
MTVSCSASLTGLRSRKSPITSQQMPFVFTGTQRSQHFVAGGRRLVRRRLECVKCVRERAHAALLNVRTRRFFFRPAIGTTPWRIAMKKPFPRMFAADHHASPAPANAYCAIIGSVLILTRMKSCVR